MKESVNMKEIEVSAGTTGAKVQRERKTPSRLVRGAGK